MKNNLYKITLLILAFIMSNAAVAQENILYVGITDDPVDTELMEYLYAEGYSTTFVTEDDFKVAPYDTNITYEPYDAIFISEVVGSGSTVNFKNAGFPIPCVTTEGYAVRSDKWALITDNDNQFKQLSSADVTSDVCTMMMYDTENWISSNYEEDYFLVWSTVDVSVNNQIGVTGFKLNENIPDAIPLAINLQDVMSEFPTMWAVPEGSTLISDGTVELPNIVFIGAISTGLGEFATDEFYDLIVNSLKWVTGDYEVINGVNKVESHNLNVWPNPTAGMVNISLTSAVSGNVRVNIYDISGRLMETFNSDNLSAGSNTINIDLSNHAAANYLYEIITEDDILRGKICKN